MKNCHDEVRILNKLNGLKSYDKIDKFSQEP